MKLVIKKKPQVPADDAILEFVRQSAGRGITARELAKRCGGEVDAIHYYPPLHRLLAAKRVWQQWTPCRDRDTHYAVQEGRYYSIDQQAAAEEEPAKRELKPKAAFKLVIRKSE